MKFDRPRVSCITTTYRKFEYLYETLDSVFQQDYPDIELIIGDDGSEQFPEQEIRAYIERNKGPNITNVVILHHSENHGTVYNCRSCRDVATGEFIFGIASDDRFIDGQVLSDVVDFFEKTGADVVTCQRQFVQAGTDKKLGCMPFPNQLKWLKKLGPQKLFEKMASMGFISGANTYYRKSLYESMGGYDTDYKYIEDYPFYLKLFRMGKQIKMFDRVTILYRHGAGISTTSHANNAFRKAMYDDRIRYLEKDIMPYMSQFPWWRKAQMKVRLARFRMEQENQDNNLFRIYGKLFLVSPVGCLVQIWYQASYKIKLKILS